MRHAAHKARKGSSVLTLTQSLFASNHGTHTAAAVYAAKSASGNAQVLGLDEKVAEKINEIAPVTRRSMREAAKAAQRKNTVLTSASLAALVGTAATSMAFMKAEDDSTMFPVADEATSTQTITLSGVDSAASRSEDRAPLSSNVLTSTANEGDWNMGDSNAVKDANSLTKAKANNEKVAIMVDQDADVLPEGFNPNHATGDNGNAYPWGQCTWWAYERRHQLGLNTGSHFGDARSWASSAEALGYWVDHTPRKVGDVLVFRPGQANADGYYGHVAVVEAVNKDGSIRISESNVKGVGVISDREFSAAEAAQFTYVHY
ncbi:MAG: CHAP domain-containing protein [Bifidobacterium sp.]|nr:CHAP domain-containing protein [Bifidobacterium sp.]